MTAIEDAARAAAAVFQTMKWTWRPDKGAYTPDAIDILRTLQDLKSMAATGGGSAGTGRLNVERVEEDGRYGFAYSLSLGDEWDEDVR